MECQSDQREDIDQKCDFQEPEGQFTDRYPPRIKGNCSQSTVEIQSLTKKIIENKTERFILLLRSGKIKNNQTELLNLKICSFHQDSYGVKFFKDYYQCRYKSSTCVGVIRNKTKKDLSLEDSVNLLDRHNIFVPFGTKICSNCNKEKNDLLDGTQTLLGDDLAEKVLFWNSSDVINPTIPPEHRYLLNLDQRHKRYTPMKDQMGSKLFLIIFCFYFINLIPYL